MAVLPVRLSPGYVSIYGSGSIHGLFQADQNGGLKFGIINQLYDDFSPVALGNSVMYHKSDAQEVSYYNDVFFIVPTDKIIAVENPLDP